MNKDSKDYLRALIGTFLLCSLFGFGLMFMWSNNEGSYLWFLGCFQISVVFVITLILAKFYVKHSPSLIKTQEKEE